MDNFLQNKCNGQKSLEWIIDIMILLSLKKDIYSLHQ